MTGPDPTTEPATVTEWRVTGLPGTGSSGYEYPPYSHVWSTAHEPYAVGNRANSVAMRQIPAEQAAREFCQAITKVEDGVAMSKWPEGPHLSSRTVTTTPWTPVDVTAAGPPPDQTLAGCRALADAAVLAAREAEYARIRESNLRIYIHEANTPMRGHDGECCVRAALGAPTRAGEAS